MKGFFSFLIIIAITIVLINFCLILQNNSISFKEIKNELIAIEEASKERTLIENNVDKIISKKIEEIIFLEETNVTNAQNKINSRLLEYLTGKAFATDFFLENEKTLTLNYLNENSVVIIFKTKEMSYIEYSYTSNITKTKNVSSKLGKKLKLFFVIPIGYSQKVIN